jgi:hypothetical protein
MGHRLVDERLFLQLIQKRAGKLLGLLDFLAHNDLPSEVLTRPLLGDLLSQAVQVEEILDSYDAGKNCKWCRIRSLTAAVKAFSDIAYELLHIRHRVSSYRLLDVEDDFVEATNETLASTRQILLNVAREMTTKARALGLKIPPTEDAPEAYAEQLPEGHLERNCGTRNIATSEETVPLLATAFLNLASASEDVRRASRSKPEEYALSLTASLREERLRSLEFQFHNLQSQYDTHVSGTEAERQDKDLPVLRGHASVVFHLLTTATLFAHYYERHVNRQPCAVLASAPVLAERDALLSALMNYSIRFIDQYIGRAVSLCHDMLKRHAKIGEVEVPIPKYCGFHVRPSTLVSKLVHHYGGKVEMHLVDEVYDAGSSLDLFRANEKINAQKKRWLAAEIVRLDLVPEHSDPDSVVSVVRSVVLALAGESKLIMYEQPLELPERLCVAEGTLLERVIGETLRLLVMHKVDVITDMTARFIGDERVLNDIRLLAESGYGEDSFGNNIALPEKLAYLRR